MSLPRCALSLSFCILLLLLPLGSSAQLPNATDTTATPAPGMHDYLGSPVETVNPANGAVSIRIPVRMAQGRQLTVPFSFAYDSNGAFYIGELSIGSGPRYITTPNPTSPAIIGTRGGWSYSYPVMSLNGGTWTIPGSLDHIITCYGSENYVFQDPNGNRHNLGLSVSANVASPDGYDNCNQGLQGDGEHTTGQEGPIAASTTIPGLNNGIYPAVSVADGDGTVYSFNGGSPGTTGLTNLATSVTDRNGNTATLTYSNLAVTYKDMLGRTALSTSGMGGSPDTITAGGLSNSYKAYWTTASASFSLDMLNLEPGVLPACPTSMSGSANVISSIVLPNGKQFTLTYDPTYGMLTKIVYPSGAYVRYVWGLNSQAEAGAWRYSANGTVYAWACRYDFPAVTDRYVSYNGTTEVLHQHFAYSTNWTNNTTSSWNYKTTTVTTTDLVRNTNFTTGYTYSPLGIASVPNCYSCFLTQQVPVEQSIQYNDIGGKQLETVTKNWASVRIMTSEETTLDDISQSSLTAYCYDINEQLLEKDEYDLGTSTPTPASCATLPSGAASGPLKRKTITSYASFPPAHIVDRPSTAITYDGSGNRVAETDYPTYDANGNLLKQTKQCFALPGGSACPQGNSTTTFTYDSKGEMLTMVDPLNNTTSFSYTDNYSACGGSAPPTSPSDAYLTQVTYPATNSVSHIIKYCYDYIKGLQLSSTDENNQTTSYGYVDSLDRLTQASYPDGGQTSYTYNDAAPSPSVTTSTKMTGTQNMTTVSVMDGLGHAVQTQLTSDLEGTDYTATTYDGQGKTYQAYNPTRCNPPTTNCGESTWGYSTSVYDALGRATSGTLQDGSPVTTSYSGNCTTVTDPATKKRTSCSDGLGRLTQVTEDPGGLGYVTTYSYDALDDLTNVVQNGSRQRSFVYDSLARLTSATNPESGTVSYTYDANSNLHTKQDARSITTTYSYDTLNRLTQKSYSDGTTPSAFFAYDGPTNGFGVPVTNVVGRLTEEWTGTSCCASVAGEIFGYDPLGRIILNEQYTPSTSYIPVNYTYDLVGDLLTATNGEGVTISYSYDSADRPTAVTSSLVDSQHPATLATVDPSVGYYPTGAIRKMTYGNGLTQAVSLQPRLQPCRINLNSSGAYVTDGCSDGTISGTIQDFDYAYGTWGTTNNGNVTVMDAVGTQNFGRSYTYDSLNRIATMSAPGDSCSGLSWTFDSWGNRTSQTATGGSCYQQPSTTFSANNQLPPPYQYDAAGNMTYDGTHTYSYDAENRLTTVDGGSTANYAYDAEGRRVQKTVSGAWRVYVHDLASRVVTEVVPSSWGPGYVYLGGNQLAEYSQSTTYFVHQDHLGSTRLLTGLNQGIVQKLDYLPYGELISTDSGIDTHKFTGKERDSESGLDNFGKRYDSSSMGRFMTPDAFYKDSHVGDPQSWNEYAYARNNPLRYVDPTGENATVSTSCSTDANNHTTCNVNVSASIAIYAQQGSNLSQQQLNQAASTIQSSIQNAWSGSFTQDGVSYNVSTQVSVSVAGSQDAAMSSGAQNVIGISNGNASATADSFVNSKSLWTAIKGGPDTGVWNINNLGTGVAAHEFTHLLGVDDKSGSVLSNTNLLNDPSIPHTATSRDFSWGIREATSSVGLGLSMKSWYDGSGGPLPTPFRFSSTDNVGAPVAWWK